jgi:uncharacterized Rossmann fold enzyme
MAYIPHPLYGNDEVVDPEKLDKLITHDDQGETLNYPIRFRLQKPAGDDGKPRDQTNDAAEHMKYAATLNLPTLTRRATPRMGKAVIVGGAPSIADHLEEIRALSKDPANMIFAVNWTHTWLIERGIVPNACIFFEIDAEPDETLKGAHPDVTYYICCHCHPKTFDELKGFKCVLWHTPPNSPIEEEVGKVLFPNVNLIGGGIGTFTRTLTIALHLGYRSIELFGVDSSFPDKSESTHVEGYETTAKPDVDGFFVYAKHQDTGVVRRFKTMGYLALQVEEFKEYCKTNHAHFALRVHGDSLLRFVHQMTYPEQYE